MIVYYLDASAWVKRYYQEVGTSWLQDLFAQNPSVSCATLGLIEVTATLARKHKAGQIKTAQMQQKLQELQTDWQYFIHLQLTPEVMVLAKGLAETLALRGADAIHLGSSLLLQSRLTQDEQLVLITSDHELKAAAQLSGLRVFDPQEEEIKATS